VELVDKLHITSTEPDSESLPIRVSEVPPDATMESDREIVDIAPIITSPTGPLSPLRESSLLNTPLPFFPDGPQLASLRASVA